MRYIGSKKLLLEEIDHLLTKHLSGDEEIFLDLFAGTNCVGNYFKDRFTIYSNDILYFSYVNAKAIIENNEQLTFEKLKLEGIDNPFLFLQENKNFRTSNYYEKSYTPSGDAMYLSEKNGQSIDFIRNQIDDWRNKDLLSEYEYFYLLSSLIEGIPSVSNITGTYGAYLKHWDKRALNDLELVPLAVTNNYRDNKAFNEDANELIKKISPDIVYIDTPYNTRQYASNYHLLENIARNEQPELSGKTKIFNWASLRSDYAMKKNALAAMSNLIENIDATHIIVSYNNEGIISTDELINLMEKYAIDGEVDIKKIPYRKYKSKKISESDNIHELLLYIRKKDSNSQKQETKAIKRVTQKWSPQTTPYLKSPLNYIGGKYKLLNQIIPLFPKNIGTFVDLFSGGANVGINVDAEHHIFNDMNNRINEMFRYFSTSNPDDLISAIKLRIDEYQLTKQNEEGYLKFRSDYNKNPNPLDLYVLVSYSYNYQFRFNNSMEFNNPFGRNRSQFSQNMEKNLRLFVSRLEDIDATFVDGLFSDLDLSGLGKDDLVYLDPPYLITTGNYNDGNRGFVNWGIEQEVSMYNLMNNLTRQGVRWALSNVTEHKGKSNDYLKSFIADNEVFVNYLDFNYDNASHNSSGTGSVEVLITNYNTENFEILKPILNINSKSVLI
ncbi:Dam family site-specific DNA-(adenine-N6)-methyltransferase [Enterococcus olivae]